MNSFCTILKGLFLKGQLSLWFLLRVFLLDLFVGPLVLRILVSYHKRIRDSVHLFVRQRLRLLVDEPMRVLVLFLPARHINGRVKLIVCLGLCCVTSVVQEYLHEHLSSRVQLELGFVRGGLELRFGSGNRGSDCGRGGVHGHHVVLLSVLRFLFQEEEAEGRRAR